MSIRENLIAWSKGDDLRLYWRLFRWRRQYKSKAIRDILTFFLNRMAHRHGGYIGSGARFDGIPVLPHGLHGVYISRYAHVGKDCWIYQNVTIGEVDRKAPKIGSHCLIGAGVVIIGNIRIGDHVRIGAGAVVHCDIPDHATVIAQPPRIKIRRDEHDLEQQAGVDRN